MRLWKVIAAAAGLGALAIGTTAGFGGALPAPAARLAVALQAVSGLRPLSIDIPAPQAEQEFCAAAFVVDGRDAARRMGTAQDTGAGFAFRNDHFRGDWLINGLTLSDPSKNWRARVDALAARLPADTSDASLAKTYSECLDQLNRDPAFTAALHEYLPYHDFP